MGTLRDLLDLVLYTPYYIIKSVRIQLLVLGSMFVFGALIYMHYQGLDLLTALLGAVSTITTIGIYAPNIVSMPVSEKALLIVVFLLSVGSAASLVQGTFTVALKSELRTEILTLRKAKRMKNHVIVVGYKFLGKYVVDNLKSLGCKFVVIAKDREQLEMLKKEGIAAVEGPATHIYETLKKAGVDRASCVISTFDDDGDNMLAVLNAKKLNTKIRAISVVNDRNLVESARAAGADSIVPIYDMMGQMLASSTISDEVVSLVPSEKFGSKYIAGFEISSERIRYKDLEKMTPILLTYRNGEIIHNMPEDFELQKGDFLYVLADNQSARLFKEKLEALRIKNDTK